MPLEFPIRSRSGGHAIRSLLEWEQFAGPVSGDQWADGYSALELAHCWLENEPINDLRSILDLVPELSTFTPELGVPEAKSSFDAYSGPRTHDLLLIGTAAGGRTVIAIEGKVNEPFGQKLDKYRAQAVRLLERKPRSKAQERLNALTEALAGWKPSDVDDERQKLRYQLFSAAAGTIAAATDAGADMRVLCARARDPAQRPACEAAERRRSGALHGARLSASHETRDHERVGRCPVRVANATTRLSARVALYVAKMTTAAAPHPSGPPPVV